jgi:tetratricopeptide (TPR) repeat protein
MRHLFWIVVAALLLSTGARAAEPDALGARLIARLHAVYLRPSSFAPAELRYPLRKDLSADLREAREKLAEAPFNLEARWRAAELAEQAEDPAAQQEWKTVLGLVEAAIKSKPADTTLLERQIQAMVGAGAAAPAAAQAEKFVAAQPRSWKAHLLAGDAYLCRADSHWRALARLAQGDKVPASPEALQLKADLEAARKEYDRAVEIAPSEAAPRAGRIGLVIARPYMASLLPAGVLDAPDKADLAVVRRELIDLIERGPGEVPPLWHAAHFFATNPAQAAAVSPGERQAWESGIAGVRAEGDNQAFLAEARGLWSFAVRDWADARKQFETALEVLPKRSFAAAWLGRTETLEAGAAAERLARARARAEKGGRSEEWTALGVLLAEDDRPAAVEALRKALALDVENAAARYNLGVLLLRARGDSSEARHHIRQVWEMQPEDPEGEFACFVLEAVDGEREAPRRALEEMLRFQELDEDLRKRIQETITDLPAPPAGKK